MVDEEFELIDHHEIGAGTVAGGDWIVAYMQPMTELAPDLKIFTIEYLGLARDRVLARLLSSGHTPEGAHVEREIYATGVIRDGKLVSSEKWPEDGREAAISRWNELLESSEA
jgi:hypothetical protein